LLAPTRRRESGDYNPEEASFSPGFNETKTMAHNRNVDSMFVSAAGMVLACLFAIVPTPAAFAENWTQFRGDDYSGVAQSQFPEVWDETQNVRWKIRVNGEGWSCPVVWEDNVFLTVAVPVSGDAQASRPQPYTGGGGQRRTDLQNKTFRWDVICLDAGTGKERWRQTARTGKPPMPRHSSNSYATETPVTDGKHVYAYFGMNGVYCYDITGTPVWQKDLGSFEMRAGWGTSSSPVLYDGKLFVQVDNEEQSFLVALDGATGNEVWRVHRDEASQYSTPIIWQNSLRAELIVGGMFYRSYDPASGRLLWQLDMEKGRSSATPIAAGDRLYVGTELRNRGGADDGGGYLFAVKPGGDGDISPPTGQTSSDYIAWKLARSGIQMASPVDLRRPLVPVGSSQRHPQLRQRGEWTRSNTAPEFPVRVHSGHRHGPAKIASSASMTAVRRLCWLQGRSSSWSLRT
jgi:outer membrane protein assembly factor BamB